MKDNTSYDEKESFFKRQKKRLIIAFSAFFFIVVISLLCEDMGVFPGTLLNRIAVRSYISDKYSSFEGSISYKKFDHISDEYVYACKGEMNGTELSFDITAKTFKVRNDGYYDMFLRDKELEASVSSYIEGVLSSAWTYDTQVKWELSIDIPKDNGIEDTSDVEAVYKKYGSSLDITCTLTGQRVDIETYKGLVYNAVYTLQQNLTVRPLHMQVFYYRDNDVCQYESRLKSYMFNYNENGIRGATDIHFYVETSEKQQKEFKAYYIARAVCVGAMILTVGIMLTIYIKKKRRFKKERI